MADVTQELLTEQLRPQEINNMLLLDRVRNEVSKGLTQNMLFYSSTPGSGKTTIARILTKGYDTLRINGSSDNGIDVVRNKVIEFAGSISLVNGSEAMKVIYIDEADGFSAAAWDALRETIEHYAGSVRFICTCNKIEKIPAPIRSRFNCIPMYPINKEEETVLFGKYCVYVGRILNAYGISYGDDATLQEFVRSSFPDMRSILNTIQSLVNQGSTCLDRESIIKTFDCSDLFELMINGSDAVENYKFISTNYATSSFDVMLEISKSFVEFLRINHADCSPKIPYIIIAIAEYMDQIQRAPDPLIVLLACCFKIQMIIRG